MHWRSRDIEPFTERAAQNYYSQLVGMDAEGRLVTRR